MQISIDTANSMSIDRYLGGTGLALWVFVMALMPDPGFMAPWLWMALFWALQIGVGLTILQTILYLMSRVDSKGRMPLWSLVAMSGLCGSVVLAPIYWLIGEGLMQQFMGFAETIDTDELRSVERTLGWAALVEEWLDISGPVIAGWALISWPRLQGLLPPLVQKTNWSVDEPLVALSQEPKVIEVSVRSWREALPRELGDDVMAVKSELQYLRVWTTRGAALVLGSLQEVEDEEGSAGMRIHRSWWVHARHVRTVRRRGEAAICELSDGREVPISRRRKADAMARFGDRARYQEMPTASKSLPARDGQNNRRNPN
ncbi:MAG: LytTR family DNA-binding domain-containing protein [Burkholderiales bacterium]